MTTTWAAWEDALGQYGLRAMARGQGLVITDGTHYVKASRVGRDLSRHALERRFGVPYPVRATFGQQGPHASVEALATIVRQYEYLNATTRQLYDATMQMSGRQASVWSASHHTNKRQAAEDDLRVATRHVRHLDTVHRSMPVISHLERAIADGLEHLTSADLKRLKQWLTEPQFALAVHVRRRVRQQMHEVLLGRDDVSERGM
jgi:hypothetical protein